MVPQILGVFGDHVTGWCQGLYPPHLQSQGKVPWRQGCCITPPYVPNPCLPSCPAYDLCVIPFTSSWSHLYLSSSCATPLSSLSPYFLSFNTFTNCNTPTPISPPSVLLPTMPIISITVITSYTLYVSPLLRALLYRHFSLSFLFSLLGPPLLCFFFCSKHQGRVVPGGVKITQG